MLSIAENLQQTKNAIRECEIRYHRIPHSVSLVAVSKNKTIEDIITAYEAGQHAFGESYLQEALIKIVALADKNIEWHFIGALQRNKTQKIAEHFDWVHSVSDGLILERLNKQRPDYLPPLNICLQVNISHEATKSGVDDERTLSELADRCASYSRLRLRGLMTIPAEKLSFDAQRAEYHQVKLLFEILCKKGLKLDTLSMGMSNDLAAAIAEGATMIRVGTKIFGERT